MVSRSFFNAKGFKPETNKTEVKEEESSFHFHFPFAY
jgi:hypothetical protein